MYTGNPIFQLVPRAPGCYSLNLPVFSFTVCRPLKFTPSDCVPSLTPLIIHSGAPLWVQENLSATREEKRTDGGRPASIATYRIVPGM